MTKMSAALAAAGIESSADFVQQCLAGQVAKLDEQATIGGALRAAELCSGLDQDERSLLVAQSRWGWEAYALDLITHRPNKLTDAAVATLSNEAALSLLARGYDSTALCNEARRRWPAKSKTMFVVTPEHGILAAGKYVRCQDVPDQFVGTSVPTIPSVGGWIEVSGEFSSVHGQVKFGRWYGNAVYQAVHLLQCHTKGTLYISPALAATFQLHPLHRFGRFFISIGNGRRENSFEVTLSPPGERSLPARHFAAIMLLTALAASYPAGSVPANLQVPDKAYWVNFEPGTTVAGKFRLQRFTHAHGQPCALVLHSGHAMPMQLRAGSSISEMAGPLQPNTARKGARVIWHKIRRGKRGALSYATLVLMPAGSFIQYQDESGITFDGSDLVPAREWEVD